MLLLVSSSDTRTRTPSGYFTTRKVSVLASPTPGTATTLETANTDRHYNLESTKGSRSGVKTNYGKFQLEAIF